MTDRKIIYLAIDIENHEEDSALLDHMGDVAELMLDRLQGMDDLTIHRVGAYETPTLLAPVVPKPKEEMRKPLTMHQILSWTTHERRFFTIKELDRMAETGINALLDEIETRVQGETFEPSAMLDWVKTRQGKLNSSPNTWEIAGKKLVLDRFYQLLMAAEKSAEVKL